MGVLSGLKARFGLGPADEYEDDGYGVDEAGEEALVDADDGRADAFDAAPDEEPPRDIPARGAHAPEPPQGGGRGINLPLISRDDVKQYIRSADYKSADADAPRRGAHQIDAAPASPAAAPAYGAPSFPGAAPSAPETRQPDYSQSAFMSPASAPAAAPEESLPAYRPNYAVPDAYDDFAPRGRDAAQPIRGGFAPAAPAAQAPLAAPEAAPAQPAVQLPQWAIPQQPSPYLTGGADPSTLYQSAAVTRVSPTAVREMAVVNPGAFDDVELIATALRARTNVVLPLRETPDHLTRRVLDFSFGAASVSGAKVALIATKVYALYFDEPLNQYEILSLRNQGVL